LNYISGTSAGGGRLPDSHFFSHYFQSLIVGRSILVSGNTERDAAFTATCH
jgi:hypothetical protein